MKVLKQFFSLGFLAVILSSCVSTGQNNVYVYTENQPLYPAIYQSIVDGSVAYSKGNGHTPLFKAARISAADIYANKFIISDLYTIDGSSSRALIGALAGSSRNNDLAFFFFDLNLSAIPNQEFTYSYNNVRLETDNGVLVKADDLPTKGKTGLPTIMQFINNDVIKIMANEKLYQEAKTSALSDPSFIYAILHNMTELQREDFFKNELSLINPTMTLEVMNVKKNTSSKYSEYEFLVSLKYNPYGRLFLESLYVTLYTNKQEVARLSKGVPYKFTGKIVGLEDNNIADSLTMID